MEFVNNDSRLLLVATSHRNIRSISNTLVLCHEGRNRTIVSSVKFAAQASLVVKYLCVPKGILETFCKT